jgi:hypothetical protein
LREVERRTKPKRAHIVLGNGSVKHKGDDGNADARDALRMCDVRDRMTAPRALAHNKYLVLCDAHQTPQAVWTGSTNWTETGLCTQANNAVLIRNVALAHSSIFSPRLNRVTGFLAVPGFWFTTWCGGCDHAQAGACDWAQALTGCGRR